MYYVKFNLIGFLSNRCQILVVLMLKLPCKLSSTVIWIAGCILNLAGSKLVGLGSKLIFLHHRPEEFRH